jgi:heat shock protein HslJ
MKSLLLTAISFYLFAACSNTNKINSRPDAHKLRGTWQLNYITGPRIAFDGLYPVEKPTITFDVTGNRISGNTSCNSFSGPFHADGPKIKFKDPLTSTKMACGGEGESVFLRNLEKIDSYDLTEGYTLSLLADGVASMRFTKVN